eukprot:scaffold110546_cov58-Phaeocystis_antarctica.AAC.1
MPARPPDTLPASASPTTPVEAPLPVAAPVQLLPHRPSRRAKTTPLREGGASLWSSARLTAQAPLALQHANQLVELRVPQRRARLRAQVHKVARRARHRHHGPRPARLGRSRGRVATKHEHQAAAHGARRALGRLRVRRLAGPGARLEPTPAPRPAAAAVVARGGLGEVETARRRAAGTRADQLLRAHVELVHVCEARRRVASAEDEHAEGAPRATATTAAAAQHRGHVSGSCGGRPASGGAAKQEHAAAAPGWGWGWGWGFEHAGAARCSRVVTAGGRRRAARLRAAPRAYAAALAAEVQLQCPCFGQCEAGGWRVAAEDPKPTHSLCAPAAESTTAVWLPRAGGRAPSTSSGRHTMTSVSRAAASSRHARLRNPPKTTSHLPHAFIECPHRSSGGAPPASTSAHRPVSKSSRWRPLASRPELLRPPKTKSEAPATATACLYRAGPPISGSALQPPAGCPFGARSSGAGTLGSSTAAAALAPEAAAAAALPPSTTAKGMYEPVPSWSGGHCHQAGANSSTACVYIYMASILLRLPSSLHADQRALATASNMDGRGSLQGPTVACLASASSRSLSESESATSCAMRPSP